jgi:hypothetical protein
MNITVLALIDRAECALADAMLADEVLDSALDHAARRLQAAARFDEGVTLLAIHILRDIAAETDDEIRRDVCTLSAEILERAKRVQDRPMSH